MNRLKPRWVGSIGLFMVIMTSCPLAMAGRDTDQVISGVLSGLLGGQEPSSPLTQQELERLASLLRNGEYGTTRQGEPVDVTVYGVPLTHVDHVYSAKPLLSTVDGQATKRCPVGQETYPDSFNYCPIHGTPLR